MDHPNHRQRLTELFLRRPPRWPGVPADRVPGQEVGATASPQQLRVIELVLTARYNEAGAALAALPEHELDALAQAALTVLDLAHIIDDTRQAAADQLPGEPG